MLFQWHGVSRRLTSMNSIQTRGEKLVPASNFKIFNMRRKKKKGIAVIVCEVRRDNYLI